MSATARQTPADSGEAVMSQYVVLVSLLCLSIIVPLAVFIGRNNIKRIRQKITDDLESVFPFKQHSQDKLIPSFEFAAYKYRALPANDSNENNFKDRDFILPYLSIS
jgi:hypothetical protein